MFTLNRPHFSLAGELVNNQLCLTMRMHEDVVSTSDLPATSEFLHAHAPDVLCTECFNDHNLPFAEEVKNTELGHLLEHLVLSDLCSVVTQERGEYSVSAVTDWDWEKDPRGTFTLRFDIDISDAALVYWFRQAVLRCAHLLEQLLSTRCPQELLPAPSANPAAAGFACL